MGMKKRVWNVGKKIRNETKYWGCEKLDDVALGWFLESGGERVE